MLLQIKLIYKVIIKGVNLKQVHKWSWVNHFLILVFFKLLLFFKNDED